MMRGLQAGVVALTLLAAIALMGCATSELEAACAARQHLPTPPSAANMARLESMKDAITSAEMTDSTWHQHG